MGVVNRRLRAPLRRVGARVRTLPQDIGVRCISSARSAPLALSPLILSLAVVWLGILSLRQRAAEQVSREEKAIEVPPEPQSEDYKA
jgi:hypothetical protein